MTPGFDAETRRTACRVRFDEGPGLWLRPNSWDYGIARCVINDNEYRLPEQFGADDLILDLGAHIGAFSYACLQRGAGKVVAFEPEPDNYALCSENLASYGDRCERYRAAAWRSDSMTRTLRLRHCTERPNTGGHDVFGGPEEGQEVACVGLDEILLGLPRRVRLLKIDCEGAEYPILLTARHLDRVDAIAGELHLFGPGYERGLVPPRMQVNGYSHYVDGVLSRHLQAQGFMTEAVVMEDGATDHGLFFACRHVM